MPRLIDADIMREDWLENGENEFVYDTNAVLESIDAQPTVDAVEVVRCYRCAHREKDSIGRGVCILTDTYCGDRDYCSRGERKDGVNGDG